MREPAPLLAPIFRSDSQARLLSTILLGEAELSLTELAARSDLAYPTAHRETARLLDAGILAERQVGRTRLISANRESPLVPPLREILLVVAGPVALLRDVLTVIPGISTAFIFGSFAARSRGVSGPSPHDIDVMIVGDPDPGRVFDALAGVSSLVKRPVNPTIVTLEELTGDSGFFEHVSQNPTVPIIGSPPWH